MEASDLVPDLLLRGLRADRNFDDEDGTASADITLPRRLMIVALGPVAAPRCRLIVIAGKG